MDWFWIALAFILFVLFVMWMLHLRKERRRREHEAEFDPDARHGPGGR